MSLGTWGIFQTHLINSCRPGQDFKAVPGETGPIVAWKLVLPGRVVTVIVAIGVPVECIQG